MTSFKEKDNIVNSGKIVIKRWQPPSDTTATVSSMYVIDEKSNINEKDSMVEEQLRCIEWHLKQIREILT